MKFFVFFITIIISINNVLAASEVSNQTMQNQSMNVRDAMEQERMKALKEKMFSDEEIERVAKEYEEVAINKMLQQMNEGIKPDPIFGGGHAEEIYRDMLITQHAKIIAETGGIGIAESIKKDMKRMNNGNKPEVKDVEHK